MHPTTSGSEPRLVGRLPERSLLRAQLSAALTGRGGLVLLSGEAGIGKTALANDVCQVANRAGALVLVGHCYDRTETPPYGPWIEIVEQFGGLRDRNPIRSTVIAPQLNHATSQGALFSEVREFLLAIAGERLLVILLEDMHWADTASFDLLRFVARQLASASILVLITYRDDEVVREHPLYRLVPMLVREALAVRIDVSPLSDDDVCALIEQAYPLSADDTRRLAMYLQERAEGNPFFLGELLRSLEGTILRQTADEGWHLGALEHTPIPVLLQQVIDARLERLGTDATVLLAVAAIIGQVVPIALWTSVVDATEETILSLVERAVGANILEATSDGLAVRFTHALIREVLYDGVLPPRRRVWHRQIGESLLARGSEPDPDVVAYHLNQAGDRRATTWLTRAGERAQRTFAWRTATLRFETALSLLEGDDTGLNERGWLRFRLALLRRFENPRAGATALEEAERLGQATGDKALVAYARFHQGMLRCQSGDLRLGIAAEEAAIAMLDGLSPADRARLIALDTTSDPLDEQNGRGELTLALAENGQLERARTLGEQIIDQPPEQTHGSRGDAFYGLGYTYAALGQPEKAQRAFASAREIFVANDYRSMVAASLFDELTVVILPYWIDQPHERERVEAELSASFAQLEDVFDQRSARVARIVSSVLDGTWAEVFAMFEQSSLRFMRGTLRTLVAPLARHQGNTALAWTLVREGLPAGPNSAPEDSSWDSLPLRLLAVRLALDAGDWDAARKWLASIDQWLDWSGSILGQADAHLCWAAFHQARGEPAPARDRANQALVAASDHRQPLTLLATHRLLGELDLSAGNLSVAEAQLSAARTLADACGSRHERALTLLALADVLLARGDLPAAQGHLETVRSLCRPMEAAVTLAKADALEERLGTPSSDTPVQLPGGLTVREAEVLRLLATGLANAEIAEHLSLSPRTINAHLTTIYSKLGVTARGAAIRFALDHDLG